MFFSLPPSTFSPSCRRMKNSFRCSDGFDWNPRPHLLHSFLHGHRQRVVFFDRRSNIQVFSPLPLPRPPLRPRSAIHPSRPAPDCWLRRSTRCAELSTTAVVGSSFVGFRLLENARGRRRRRRSEPTGVKEGMDVGRPGSR